MNGEQTARSLESSLLSKAIIVFAAYLQDEGQIVNRDAYCHCSTPNLAVKKMWQRSKSSIPKIAHNAHTFCGPRASRPLCSSRRIFVPHGVRMHMGPVWKTAPCTAEQMVGLDNLSPFRGARPTWDLHAGRAVVPGYLAAATRCIFMLAWCADAHGVYFENSPAEPSP